MRSKKEERKGEGKTRKKRGGREKGCGKLPSGT